MPAKDDPLHWARRVSRADVRRLYESDAQGRLDTTLLDEVGYGIYARCLDMFEVRKAINGEVTCRSCRKATIRRRGWHQGEGGWVNPKLEALTCPQCGWSVTWGEFYDAYTGNRMLPGSATTVFDDFVARWPRARTPAQKLELIDDLIHEFHVNQGIDGRPVGENVITGTRAQVIALIEALAYGDTSLADPANAAAWRARLDDPVRRFRQAHAWQEVRTIARDLGIPAPDATGDQRSVVEEILERSNQPSAISDQPEAGADA